MCDEFEEWPLNVDPVHLRRSNVNKLIMDYLVAEGFKEAAEKFKHEAGVEMTRYTTKSINDSSLVAINGTSSEEMNVQLEQRVRIREAIEAGKIKTALYLINQYYPEMIDENRALYFKLQQQYLIELIRDKQTEEALNFAQEKLRVDEEFLQLLELERTLALLAFDKPESSPYADLLQLSHRQQLASEVNEIIIKEQSGAAEVTKPHIVTQIKLLLYTQSELERKKVPFKKMTDIANGKFA